MNLRCYLLTAKSCALILRFSALSFSPIFKRERTAANWGWLQSSGPCICSISSTWSSEMGVVNAFIAVLWKFKISNNYRKLLNMPHFYACWAKRQPKSIHCKVANCSRASFADPQGQFGLPVPIWDYNDSFGKCPLNRCRIPFINRPIDSYISRDDQAG